MTFLLRRVEWNSTHGFAFALEQLLFARRAPAPAAGRAVFADDAVARHDQRQLVGTARATDRARGIRRADHPRDLAVAARLAGGDAGQGIPNPPLERRSGDVQRRQPRLSGVFAFAELRGDALDHHRKPFVATGIHARNLRTREFVAQFLQQGIIVVADIHRAQAARGRGDQYASERACQRCVTDRHARSTFAIARRWHAEQTIRVFVDAAAGAEAGVVDRIGDGCALARRPLEFAEPLRAGVFRRRHAVSAAECALQVTWREADLRGEFAQVRHLVAAVEDFACAFERIGGSFQFGIHDAMLGRARDRGYPILARGGGSTTRNSPSMKSSCTARADLRGSKRCTSNTSAPNATTARPAISPKNSRPARMTAPAASSSARSSGWRGRAKAMRMAFIPEMFANL